jgi:translation initiation factor 2B subunit (eIF-2B alpha/beta/delta family)
VHVAIDTLPCAVQKLHPAILELGLAYADGSIAGSTARTIAMLSACNRAISEYTPPEGVSFSRALAAAVNAAVGFLWFECRPACVPQRNSVKWLKGVISTVRSSTRCIFLHRCVVHQMSPANHDAHVTLHSGIATCCALL